MTQLDKAGKVLITSKDGVQARPSRAQSATHSEASHTEQQTIARSVSAVTIRQRESTTPTSQPLNAVNGPKTHKVDVDGRKGTVFMTDGESKPSSRTTSARETHIPQRKPPAAPRQQGCKDFKETHKKNSDGDDENHKGGGRDTAADPGSTSATSANRSHSVQQGPDGAGRVNGVKEHSHVSAESEVCSLISTITPINESGIDTPSPSTQIIWSQPDKSLTQSHSSKHQEVQDRSAFITAGFLTLESMITEARNMLRHSYSLNDLDKSCDWEQPIGSPRSLEVLNKGVRFAEEMECYHMPSATENEVVEEPELHTDNRIGSTPVKAKIQDLVLYTGPEANNSLAEENPAEESSSPDMLQRKSAAKESMHGIHGEMSEYLTTRSTVRQIYPPPPSPAPPLKHQPITSRLTLTSHLASLPNVTPVSSTDPPPTPVNGRALSPVSEAMTPDDNSVISDWELSPLDDGKCFLETLVDLLPEEVKALHQVDTETKPTRAMEPLPDVLEGQIKPVTNRHNPGTIEPIASVPPACFRVNTLPPEGHVFYFTYDADLHQTRFSTLIGRPVTDQRWAILFGFQLVFNKLGLDVEAGSFPNIEANPYTSTEGGVYTLTHDELARVDAHHGYPDHYSRLIVPVWVCNSADPDLYSIAQYCVPAVTYIAQQEWTTPVASVPAESREYSVRQVMKGASQLSSGYRDHLSSLLQECCV